MLRDEPNHNSCYKGPIYIYNIHIHRDFLYRHIYSLRAIVLYIMYQVTILFILFFSMSSYRDDQAN